MKILIKDAKIIDPESPFHKQKVNILIKDGLISEIGKHVHYNSKDNDIQQISFPDLHVSKGWFDSSVSFGEPGFENAETISNGLEVASKSGFTDIALQPDTKPIIDSNTGISFIKSKAAKHAVSIYPIGALTLESKGEQLAELYDMQSEGAVAFGDYKKPLDDANLFKLALQYAQNFDGLIISFPQNNQIAAFGNVNEGKQSTLLGLKGIPSIAEEIQISRDLAILEYTGGKLHIPTVSTRKSLELIKKAKTKGLNVSCSVSVNHLIHTDQVLNEFNTNYKLLPPLRTELDREAIKKGIKDHTIDMITTDHKPVYIEDKKVEFEHAAYGAIGLESAFGILNNELGTDLTIRILTKGKAIFNINHYQIAVNEPASLTLFNPKGQYLFSDKHILSTSKNSALIGQSAEGYVYGIISNKKVVLNMEKEVEKDENYK